MGTLAVRSQPSVAQCCLLLVRVDTRRHNSNHSCSKALSALHCRRLRDPHVFVSSIRRDTASKHTQRRCDLLDGGKSDLACGVGALLKVVLSRHHTMQKAIEYPPAHSESSSKDIGRVHGVWCEVATHDALVAGGVFAVNVTALTQLRAATSLLWCLKGTVLTGDDQCNHQISFVVITARGVEREHVLQVCGLCALVAFAEIGAESSL